MIFWVGNGCCFDTFPPMPSCRVYQIVESFKLSFIVILVYALELLWLHHCSLILQSCPLLGRFTIVISHCGSVESKTCIFCLLMLHLFYVVFFKQQSWTVWSEIYTKWEDNIKVFNIFWNVIAVSTALKATQTSTVLYPAGISLTPPNSNISCCKRTYLQQLALRQ